MFIIREHEEGGERGEKEKRMRRQEGRNVCTLCMTPAVDEGGEKKEEGGGVRKRRRRRETKRGRKRGEDEGEGDVRTSVYDATW